MLTIRSSSHLNTSLKSQRKLATGFLNKQWCIYLKNYLEDCQKSLADVEWPTEMLYQLCNIVEIGNRTRIDMQYLSDFKLITWETQNAKHKNIETNQPIDSVVLSYEKDKLGIKKDILDVTGFYLFNMEQDEFIKQVDKIKEHLKEKNHPLTAFIKHFDEEFSTSYIVYMCKEEQLDGLVGTEVNMNDLCNQITTEIKCFISVVQQALFKYYNLDADNDEIKADLITTYLTNLILKKSIYFIAYNLISIQNKTRIQKFGRIFKRLQDTKPIHYGTNKILSMDAVERCNLIGPGTRSSTKKSMKQPYFRTIKQLRSISNLESPIKKLERMYQVYSSL